MASILIILIGLIAQPIFAQSQEQQKDQPEKEETIKLKTDLVTFDAQVINKKTGRLVEGLKSEDFTLYEEGVKQELTYFSHEQLPLSIILLMDINSNMLPVIDQLRHGSLQVLLRLKPDDEIALMSFGARANLVQGFTKDRKLITQGIDKIVDSVGENKNFIKQSIYDAAVQMRRANNPASRRVIIVVSNNFSNEPILTLGTLNSKDETIKQLYATGSIVCGLITGTLGEKLSKELSRKFPDQIIISKLFSKSNINVYAQETGGEIFQANREMIEDRLLTLIDNLRIRYSFGYTSSNTENNIKENKYLKIKLQLSPEVERREGDLAIYARKGYYTQFTNRSSLTNFGADLNATIEDTEPTYHIINLMPDFWNCWQKANGLDNDAKIKLFQQTFVQPYAEIFNDQENLNRSLEKYFTLIEPQIKRLDQFSTELMSNLRRNQQSFARRFPGLTWEGDIYFLPSFGQFETKVCTIKGRKALLFGLDTIAIKNRPIDFWPLFHYQLFRIYHEQFQPEIAAKKEHKLYELLWNEGLAIYASKSLNPTSEIKTAIFHVGSGEDPTYNLALVANRIRGDINNDIAGNYESYIGSDLPGSEVYKYYYIGILIAERLSAGYQLPALLKLKGEELDQAINLFLRKIENGQIK